MAEENNEPIIQDDGAQDENILEVEKIDIDVVDPNNALYGEDGELDRYVDEESGKTYIRKTNKPDQKDGEEDNDVDGEDRVQDDEDEETGKTDPKDGGQEDGEDGDEDEGDSEITRENSSNVADYILKTIGYDKDTIDLGEGEVNIADLTPEKQLEVADSELENMIENYETATGRGRN